MKNESSKRIVEVKNKKFTFGAIIIIAFYEVKNTDINTNTQIGLKAVLVPNTYVRSADGLSASFNVQDKDNENNVKVSYSGEIGSVFFNEYSELIMQGYFDKKDTFVATNLSVRCPSKYMTEEDYS